MKKIVCLCLLVVGLVEARASLWVTNATPDWLLVQAGFWLGTDPVMSDWFFPPNSVTRLEGWQYGWTDELSFLYLNGESAYDTYAGIDPFPLAGTGETSYGIRIGGYQDIGFSEVTLIPEPSLLTFYGAGFGVAMLFYGFGWKLRIVRQIGRTTDF